MIVVEGFDASGKSTLAKRIADLLDWPILHTGGPTTDEVDVMTCLHRSEQRMRMRVVQDRITHISESVYSHLEFPAKAARALDAIREIPSTTFVVYCKPPPEFLIDALTHEHEQHAWDTGDHLERLHRDARSMIAFYDTVMAMVRLRCPVYIYDRSCEPDAGSILKIIEERFL